ncbi:hypothetical protein [Actinoplanes sp. NPDC049681]|uniref:hypothetical protein n=1 Tax=Actinoplanes sp. NPDC049681 TaxID=3363905 RepID=UPI0037B22B4A
MWPWLICAAVPTAVEAGAEISIFEASRSQAIFGNTAGNFSVATPAVNDATGKQITDGGFGPAS